MVGDMLPTLPDFIILKMT